PGVKTRKSSIPGVTIIEFTDDIPQGCSAPDIERRPIPLTMQEGKTANFKAAVRGNPVPTLVWSFKGESLSDGNKYKVSYDRIMNEYVLQIKQLTIDDAGSYKCTVSNEYGEARCAANLNIIEVGYKKKMKKPGEIQGKNTDPTDFRKMLKKRAPPPVKKEQKVPDEKVWEILMHADKKDYERICMEYGLTDFRGMLTKLKQMKKDREEKQTQYVKEISNLKHVETKSDGSASFGFDMELKSPELNIYLYKDGKLIPHSLDKDQKHHLKHVGKRYTFCIKDLHLDDVGLYRVNVEDTEVFATVVDISLIPVDFIHKLQDVKCKEGEDAIFECTISLPLPAEWSYKKIPLENNDKYEIKVSPDGLTQSLIIKNVHHVDKGVYIISAGAGYSSAYLSVGKNLDTASPPSLRKEMESKHSQEDFTDINLEQELNDATKRGLKGRRSSLHDKDLLTKDDLKRKSNYSSEEDSINFGRGGLQSASIDGLDDATKNGQSVYDRMEKDDIGGFNSFGKGGFDGFDGMGRDGKHGLDGIERDGKGGLGGMGRYGKGGLDGMGRDGKGGLDGMGRDGKGGLDGMGRDGKSGLDGMGRYGKFGLGGMGRDGKDELEEMGRDRKGGLGGMGRDGKGGLEGMGRDGKDGLDGMGSDGKGGLEGMGRDGKGGLGRMGRDGRGGLGGMGRDGKGGLEGMGRDGKDGLEGMGRDGKGGLGGMGRDGKDGLGGMGRDGREPVQRFKSGLLDVSAQKGKAAEFCCVTANENTQGTWFKNGTKITSGNGKIVTKEGAVQKLTIPNVKEEDSGMYTFEADGGKTEASLFVEDPPEFDQDVLDQLGKKDTIIKAGHTATVKVPFSGKPPIKVSWYKDGEELFEDNRVSIDNSKSFTRLSISKCNRKDSGKMTIKLKNESGTTSADVNLAVIDKPQAPQGPLEILASLENCISFKWKPPRDDGGKPIQHYVIERQQVGRNTWTKVGEVDKSTTTFSYDKVEPEKKYKFKIWAVNSEGKSEALLSDVITAGRKDVPGAPAKPNILSASSKSITVSWTPPQNTGGSRIIGYIIEKRKKGSNIWSAVTDTPVTGKKWTITDVIEGLEYEFRVIAVNSSGPGEPSCETEAAFAREPMKVPGTVRDLRVTDSTYSTISLAWTPPIYKGSDIPKGYIVEMKSSGNAAWTRCNSAAVGLNSYTVKGLKKMGMYFLRVRAVSDGGMGEPMELDNYVLAMPPPVHPKFILDESVKSFMIIKEGNSLRVQMPFEASPPPEVIWLKDGFPVSEQATITSTSGSTQLIIPASQRSHSGIYSVTLKNLLGQESFSFEIRVTAVPKPPGPVTLTENVPNSVTISWEPSSDEPLDDHLHYVVMQRDSRRLKWHTVRENIFNNKFTVINIVPGCKYYFRVLAKNDMGYSEPSDTREPWCILRQRDPFALKLPIYKARSNMTAPEFIVRLKTHIAPSGSDINMSCAVKGFPPPKVIWFKDNINIMDDANFWSTNIYGNEATSQRTLALISDKQTKLK
ncbi:hypothetical protein chiPu_0010597, partial [Chiloscyllium punctatum]|nr:hypothetical protein [Chiloscyllium punctatum]